MVRVFLTCLILFAMTHSGRAGVPAPGDRSIRRAFGQDQLWLRNGRLTLGQARGPRHVVDCGAEGAWGLWVDDVDGDGRLDLVLALRKRARFDPVLENRLHVYTLVRTSKDRRDVTCVPLWRGTRLAGRFDAIGDVHGGRLLALERTGADQMRVARYSWRGFGFAVQRVLWRGHGRPPARLSRLLDPAPRKDRP